MNDVIKELEEFIIRIANGNMISEKEVEVFPEVIKCYIELIKYRDSSNS